MFDSELGGQISWLFPSPSSGLVGWSVADAAPPRTDRQRAGFVLWGGTLLMYLAVYDYAQGIFHPYYTVVMAPAVAALAGAGAVALWRLGRQSLRWAWVLPAAIVGTVLWADALLARTSGYDSWLGPTVVVTGVISALVLFLCMARPRAPLGSRSGRVSWPPCRCWPGRRRTRSRHSARRQRAIATAGPASGGSGLAGAAGPGWRAPTVRTGGRDGARTAHAVRVGAPSRSRQGSPGGLGFGGGAVPAAAAHRPSTTR